MGYLSPVDAAFLRMESSRTPMHVGGLMVFKLPEGAPADYLRKLYDRIRQSSVETYPFNCKLKKGRFLKRAPSWEPDPNIDIDYHVRHSALPYPGGERELGVLVARLHSHPVDMSRPLWEFHLIEGLENNRFAFYLKAHHSAVDGMGAMRMVKRWLSTDPSADNGYAPWSMPLPEVVRSETGKLSRFESLRNQLNSSEELMKLMLKMSKPSENPEGGMLSAIHTPRSRFNLHVGQQRRLATQLFDMDRFHNLSVATGTTINDIALSIIGDACRRYLLELEDLPEQPLIASIPIGLQRADGQPGNAVAGFVCPLFTEQDDPLERVKTIHTITQRTKDQLKGMSKSAMTQFSILGLSPLMLGQMTRLGTVLPPFFNLVVSNVVASREKLYLAGSEMEAMYPISILFDGYALNVTIVGYADRIALGFTGCREAIPSLQRLAVYTGEALDKLERMVLGDE